MSDISQIDRSSLRVNLSQFSASTDGISTNLLIWGMAFCVLGAHPLLLPTCHRSGFSGRVKPRVRALARV
jgi:hypothetical protein